MTRVLLSPAAFDDLERLEEFLWQSDDLLQEGLLDFIFDALAVLTHQPGIGRPAGDGLRELIISRRRSGYLAKYHFDESADLVRVLRIRHQRESGYAAEEI
jgi:plasmid stabilization system protein ParE